MSEVHDLVQLMDIRKTFNKGTPDEIKALAGVNLNVYAEDFIAVIGSNGAGKTTTLNILAGVFPPEKGGKIIIEGKDVTGLSEHGRARYIGRVYQDPHLGTAGNMSIEENMCLALMRGRSRGLRLATNKQRRDLFCTKLESLGLGLENRLGVQVGTLSGGQRQALALVMAALSKTTLLLLDEHIATLDPKTARIVLDLTQTIIQKEKITAMMVTHNMETALKFGNRLIMMHKGRIIVDIDQKQRSNLTVNDLVSAFEKASGEQFATDRVLLREE